MDTASRRQIATTRVWGSIGSAEIFAEGTELTQRQSETCTTLDWPDTGRACGRFLIRLSDSLFLAPQSDLEKKQHTARKSSARNAQIRGLFASTPKAEDFLATQELQSGQFGLRMKVSARIKPVLCVFGKLVC